MRRGKRNFMEKILMSNITSVTDIPVILITADCLPEAWEKAVLAVWDKGLEVKTQYDKSNHPPSKDATAIITINDPFSEPRIHKNFPGGPEELESYRQGGVQRIYHPRENPRGGQRAS